MSGSPLPSKAGVAIRLALNLSDQLESYVADMDISDLADLHDAAEALRDEIAVELARRQS